MVRAHLLALALVLFFGCVQPPDDPVSAAGNRKPIIQSLTADPANIPVGSTSTITIAASDPDNNPLTYRWSASSGDIIGEGSTVRFTASFCCTGPNLVKATVKDNAGGESSQSVDVFIFYR
ncbi:MAG: hypothetical protein HW412_1876 [Bacteroidetes bacterium]|nr:hypothetical protein [Bacteroidota bacterium]